MIYTVVGERSLPKIYTNNKVPKKWPPVQTKNYQTITCSPVTSPFCCYECSRHLMSSTTQNNIELNRVWGLLQQHNQPYNRQINPRNWKEIFNFCCSRREFFKPLDQALPCKGISNNLFLLGSVCSTTVIRIQNKLYSVWSAMNEAFRSPKTWQRSI